MMLRRRMPRPTAGARCTPPSSGPRCSMAWHMSSISAPATGPPRRSKIPAMPHMSELDQALAQRVAHEPRRLVDTELLHDPRAVGLGRLDADEEQLRHLAGLLALGQ